MVVLRDVTALIFLLASIAIGASQATANTMGPLAGFACAFLLGPVLTVIVLWAQAKVRIVEAIASVLTGDIRTLPQNPYLM